MSSLSQDPALWKQALSMLLDFVPFVGSGKSAIECVRGKDLITGEHMNRWLAAGGLVLGLVPFGKLVTRGMARAESADRIASQIARGGATKEAVSKRIENIISSGGADTASGLMIQQAQFESLSKKELEDLEKEFRTLGCSLASPKCDRRLVHQLIVEAKVGHAVFKHWLVNYKKLLLPYLSESQKAKVLSMPTDAEELEEYLKMILKDPKTVKLHLPYRGKIGFANAEKKVLIIHNPKAEGTLLPKSDSIDALHALYESELISVKADRIARSSYNKRYWSSEGKKELLSHLSTNDKQEIESHSAGGGQLFEYLKFILKDPKTVQKELHRGQIAFANDEKKVLIIEDPVEGGTVRFEANPTRASRELYAKGYNQIFMRSW